MQREINPTITTFKRKTPCKEKLASEIIIATKENSKLIIPITVELFAMARPAKHEISLNGRKEAAHAMRRKYESLS
ncbi:MAG: hypothetical protein II821_09500 [Treponema sp.]|nr:hypothetical protein [Treponema sp.]